MNSKLDGAGQDLYVDLQADLKQVLPVLRAGDIPASIADMVDGLAAQIRKRCEVVRCTEMTKIIVDTGRLVRELEATTLHTGEMRRARDDLRQAYIRLTRKPHTV